MKVTFSLPNIGKGVVITKWKEIKTFPSKDFSPFTVEFLGNKIDHGDSHTIFFKKTYQNLLWVSCLKLLKTYRFVQVYYDPALVDMAKKKKGKQIYTLCMQKEQM